MIRLELVGSWASALGGFYGVQFLGGLHRPEMMRRAAVFDLEK